MKTLILIAALVLTVGAQANPALAHVENTGYCVRVKFIGQYGKRTYGYLLPSPQYPTYWKVFADDGSRYNVRQAEIIDAEEVDCPW